LLEVRDGFTLIDLLIIIAVIAVLSIVVLFIINPGEQLAQARDANRLSDLSILNNVINLYQSTGLSLGSSSVVYVSIPDSSP
jgi:competence protein ComGC